MADNLGKRLITPGVKGKVIAAERTLEDSPALMASRTTPGGPGDLDNSSGSSSETEFEAEMECKKSLSERNLKARAKHRLKKYVNEIMESVEGLTFLERQAVSRLVEKYYLKDYKQLTEYCLRGGTNMDDEQALDTALVRYFNELYRRGEQHHRGEKVLATLMHHKAEYGRLGAKKIPRAWRALKGWRKLTPAAPYPPIHWRSGPQWPVGWPREGG